MQKEGEAVRKSNVIIIAILMVASIAFLWLWNYLGFHLIDMRDLVITILWWIITIGLCIAIHIAEKRRRERIRTIFISDGVLYNPEVGVVRLESNDPQAYVDGMRELLDNLNYDPNVSPDASQKRLRFSYNERDGCSEQPSRFSLYPDSCRRALLSGFARPWFCGVRSPGVRQSTC